MKRQLLAIAAILPIAGCSAVGQNNVADTEGCVMALVAAGTYDAKTLLNIAASNAACRALAADILAALVKSVSSGQAAARAVPR